MKSEIKTVAKTLTNKLSKILAVLVCVAFATGCAITPRHGLAPHDILKSSARNLARTGNQISRSIGHDADLVLSHGYGKRHGRQGRRSNRGGVSVHGYGHGGPIVGIIAGTVLVAVLIAAAASGGSDHGHEHD